MTTFRILPLALALAAMAGAAGAQSIDRFDGTWEGTLKVVTNSCPKFDMVPLTVVIDGSAITATSKVDGSLMARGEVSEFGEATLAGSRGARYMRISGRFIGDGFKGAGKIFRPYNNCEAKLALKRTPMAVTAEAASPPRAVVATSPPPAAAPFTAAGSPPVPPAAPATAHGSTLTQATAGRLMAAGRDGCTIWRNAWHRMSF